jgi:DNA-binding response OmpR family regulator
LRRGRDEKSALSLEYLFSVTPDPTAQAGATERRRSKQTLRILMVDDDRDTVDMLSIVLRDEGHVVHGVYNGKEVLPAARILRPDAIIVDISVPGMSGYAVAQEIRHTYTEARRPLLIALSGMWKEPSDRMVAQQVGFDHHLVKPCDTADLLALLEPLRRSGAA